MKKLIIFGIGQISQVAYYFFSEDSDYEIAGFTVNDDFIDCSQHMGLPVAPFEEIHERFPPCDFKLFIAIGYGKMNLLRRNKLEETRTKGYELAHYVSSRAFVPNKFEARDNLFVLENNVIQPYTTIGENVTLWSGNHIGHHSVIEDDVFISSQVIISGAVRVGRASFLGVNSTIGDNISIGAENIIGAGSLVLKNTADKAGLKAHATEAAKITSDQLRSF